jgi:hypothetical protein
MRVPERCVESVKGPSRTSRVIHRAMLHLISCPSCFAVVCRSCCRVPLHHCHVSGLWTVSVHQVSNQWSHLALPRSWPRLVRGRFCVARLPVASGFVCTSLAQGLRSAVTRSREMASHVPVWFVIEERLRGSKDCFLERLVSTREKRLKLNRIGNVLLILERVRGRGWRLAVIYLGG